MNVDSVVGEFIKTVENTHKFGNLLHNSIKEPKEKPHKIFMLAFLKEIGKSKLKDIAGKTGQSTQNLCMQYNSFEKEGLIAREIDPTDRRNTFYDITPKGIKLIEEHKKQAREIIKEMFSELSKDDVTSLKNCLEKVNNIIEKML